MSAYDSIIDVESFPSGTEFSDLAGEGKALSVIPPDNSQELTKMSPMESVRELFMNMADSLSLIVENTLKTNELLEIVTGTDRDSDIEKGDTDLDNKPPGVDKGPGMLSGLLDGLKDLNPFGGSGSALKTALVSGLGLIALQLFGDTIEKAITAVFQYAADLKKAFDEDGFGGVITKLQEDFIEKVANPLLSTLGMKVNEDGSLGLLKGSFLDNINPFGGPTAPLGFIPDAIAALWKGETKDGKAFIPDWARLPINETEWYKTGQKFFGERLGDGVLTENIKGLFKGEFMGKPFLPEWMTKPINEFDWYKNFENILETDYATKVADTISGLWKGEWNGKPFLPEWMTKPINEMSWYNSIKDNVSTFLYNDETGEVFGIDFSKLKEAFPTLSDIINRILDGLPDWLKLLKPKTAEEKALEKELTQQEIREKEDVKELKKSGAFDKDLAGYSEIDREKLKSATQDQLISLLKQESDDLRVDDYDYILNLINEMNENSVENPIKDIIEPTRYNDKFYKKTLIPNIDILTDDEIEQQELLKDLENSMRKNEAKNRIKTLKDSIYDEGANKTMAANFNSVNTNVGNTHVSNNSYQGGDLNAGPQHLTDLLNKSAGRFAFA